MNIVLPTSNPPDPIEEAARQQAAASDPAVSAFVSASAGSGKTKLLIDRLLRLMLPDPSRDRTATPPERILCLTFTKAGAAEMALRLRRVLGEWVVAPEGDLDRHLGKLGLTPTEPLRAEARSLFARILELPGGLRIGTIHAFCEQLLRRFPLEAAISPHFRLVEEHDTGAALDRAREGTIGRDEAAAAVACLAARIDAERHSDLTRRLHAASDRLSDIHALSPDALAGHLARTLEIAHRDEQTLLADAVTHADALRSTLQTILAEGPEGAAAKAAFLLDWLARSHAQRTATWSDYRDSLLTEKNEPRVLLGSNTKLARSRPDLVEALAAEARRVRSVEGARNALILLESTAALLAVSGPALAAYTAEKVSLGILDFDDLIRRTRDLLKNPGVAWVLFKLDGGLDHLLLDEVQDTSAAQWAIAGALTEEFFAGVGAAQSGRTIFAVGDVKQSIYAFQGADPRGFQTWREHFRARAGQVATFVDPQLTVSFRSSPAILRFVDTVFADPTAAAGVAIAPHQVPPHNSAQPDLAGAVELWPLARNDTDEPASPWQAPTQNRGLQSGQLRLAEALATHIAAEIRAGRERPGDILVLVRRRTLFAGTLMRALKARDVPVAGLDRMVLTDQPAVIDLLALCDALLLPDDDLALAELLTSPLGGLDDPSLMDLALNRQGPLWRTLDARHHERPDWHAAHAFFTGLLARVDYIPPYALLAEALGARGGRARLLSRFGPEAADAIDEFLSAALAHAATRIPSMQGFVHWVRLSGAEIKREPAEASAAPAGPGEVRLMTVHGSKGLEARTVILADTTSLPRNDEPILWPEDDGAPPIWVPGAGLRCPPVDRLRDAQYGRVLEEYNRLLYVALTRARQRLLVCGWQTGRKAEPDQRSWYAHCARAIAALPTETIPPDPAARLEGDRRVHRHPGREPAPPATAASHISLPPDWAGTAPGWRALPPPAEPTPRRSLTPSRPDGVQFGPVPPALSPRARAGRAEGRRRGNVLHALLQHLPDRPSAERPAAARRFARAHLPPDQADALAAEALAIIAHPALALIFGPAGRPEQRVAGRVGAVDVPGRVGEIAVTGIVDRLAITPDAIELVDFKSGRAAPATPERTPVFYLRQMSAYRAVLRTLRPGIPVRCVLVWTADATVTPLPDALLDAHAPLLDDGPRTDHFITSLQPGDQL